MHQSKRKLLIAMKETSIWLHGAQINRLNRQWDTPHTRFSSVQDGSSALSVNEIDYTDPEK